MLRRLLYSPFLAQLVVTRRCNLSCGYCNEFDDVSDPVPTTELERRIDNLKRLGTWALELTGGEPMMHPDIAALVAYAKRRRRFHRVWMISNAFLFNEERIEALNCAGLDHLQVSVDGVEPNEVTTKVLRHLRPKLEVLARVARFQVTLSAVIGSATSREVLSVIAYAQEKGFRPRVLLLHGEDGQLTLGPDQLALYHHVRRELGDRFVEARDYRTRLIREGRAPFRCRAGSRYLYVDEHGVVRWCSQQREHFGIPLADYGFDDLRRQFHAPKACNVRCTIGCARTSSAPDEWRPQRGPTPPPADLIQIGTRSRRQDPTKSPG